MVTQESHEGWDFAHAAKKAFPFPEWLLHARHARPWDEEIKIIAAIMHDAVIALAEGVRGKEVPKGGLFSPRLPAKNAPGVPQTSFEWQTGSSWEEYYPSPNLGLLKLTVAFLFFP